MPILTLPLAVDGAIVDLLVGVSEPRRQALVAANIPVPPAVQIRALIDPGATVTCIEGSAIHPLDLVPTGCRRTFPPLVFTAGGISMTI